MMCTAKYLYCSVILDQILFKGSEKRAAPGDKSEEDLDKFDEGKYFVHNATQNNARQ